MVGGPVASTFRLEDQGLCWPLLFHVEPLVAAYPSMGAIAVTVVDERGSYECTDVASARAESRQHPPHRVELSQSGGSVKLIKLWMIGFGPGQEPAVTIDGEYGLDKEVGEIRTAIARVLDQSDPATQAPAQGPPGAPAGTGSTGRWHWLTQQPLGVQIIGGVIATLAASAIVAIVTVLFR